VNQIRAARSSQANRLFDDGRKPIMETLANSHGTYLAV
jgi:hypothetical protein